MQRVVLVRHGTGPEDDRVVTTLRALGYELDTRRPFQGQTLGPVTDDVAGTVIYGGMYNADAEAEHPFLTEEYRWIGAMLDAGLPVLGICQGAQMIAFHQGAAVGPVPENYYEFGYYEVSPTPEGQSFLPEPHHFSQAHYHTFDLPRGACHLARSALFEHQAFRLGDRVYGLQFHPEQTRAGFTRWQSESVRWHNSPGAQSKAEQDRLGELHDAAQDRWFTGFLTGLFGAAET